MTELDRVETVAHLATLYNKTTSALRWAIKRGRLDAYKSGATWLSTRRDVEEYLTSDRRKKEN